MFGAAILLLLLGASSPSCAYSNDMTPPPALAARLQALSEAFGGRVGIAVEDTRQGWIASYNGSTLFPQQSVAKLWVALAVFKAADSGRLGLSDPVVVRRKDMSVFNQPIQKRLGPNGFATTVDGLLTDAIAKSDNAANDILVRILGGPASVRRTLADFHLGALRAGEEERVLESRIAGVSWRPEYSFGRAFWTARERVPLPVRSARLDAYVVDPEDGATPVALTDGLCRLQRGELLSPAGSRRFLQILTSTETGPMRLKAGLGPGWSIAHKTGTGQDLGALSTGYNDVGLLTAPDGHVYAVAVMIGSTRRPIPQRQALMAAVTRAVVTLHDGGGV
ncbi:MAG: serine hydrolase [Caulobacteraceae bacterium]